LVGVGGTGSLPAARVFDVTLAHRRTTNGVGGRRRAGARARPVGRFAETTVARFVATNAVDAEARPALRNAGAGSALGLLGKANARRTKFAGRAVGVGRATLTHVARAHTCRAGQRLRCGTARRATGALRLQCGDSRGAARREALHGVVFES